MQYSTDVLQLPPVEPGIVKIKVRVTSHNAVLLNRRKALNLSQSDVGMRAGLSSFERKNKKRLLGAGDSKQYHYQLYGEIELLRKWPTEQQRSAICDVLGLLPESAFPQELYLATGLPSIKKEIEMEARDYVFAMDQWKELQESQTDPHKQFEEGVELPKLIQDALGGLSEREREVLNMLFGLGGGEEMTLEVIAGNLKLSRERVRQIKEKAIRKLRQKNKATVKLLDYVTVSSTFLQNDFVA